MSAESLKTKLEKSLEVFATGILLSIILIFLTIIFNQNFWIFGFTPTLFIYSLIGILMVSKALVSFTEFTGSVNVDADEFESKFVGSNGVNNIFWMFVVIIFILIVLASYILNYNILHFTKDAFSIIHGLFSFISLVWGLYTIVTQLSFTIFFISIIPTMFSNQKNDSSLFTVKKINDETLNNSYNYSKNLKKIAQKYNSRILWLEQNISKENEIEYKAKIYIYETVLRDIADMINSLDV